MERRMSKQITSNSDIEQLQIGDLVEVERPGKTCNTMMYNGIVDGCHILLGRTPDYIIEIITKRLFPSLEGNLSPDNSYETRIYDKIYEDDLYLDRNRLLSQAGI